MENIITDIIMVEKIMINMTLTMSLDDTLFFEFIHMQPSNVGIPTENMMPQNTKRLDISRATANSGNYEQINPIAVLAESI